MESPHALRSRSPTSEAYVMLRTTREAIWPQTQPAEEGAEAVRPSAPGNDDAHLNLASAALIGRALAEARRLWVRRVDASVVPRRRLFVAELPHLSLLRRSMGAVCLALRLDTVNLWQRMYGLDTQAGRLLLGAERLTMAAICAFWPSVVEAMRLEIGDDCSETVRVLAELFADQEAAGSSLCAKNLITCIREGWGRWAKVNNPAVAP